MGGLRGGDMSKSFFVKMHMLFCARSWVSGIEAHAMMQITSRIFLAADEIASSGGG